MLGSRQRLSILCTMYGVLSKNTTGRYTMGAASCGAASQGAAASTLLHQRIEALNVEV